MQQLTEQAVKQPGQKETEDFIREVLTKVCPFHGKHANIELDRNWKVKITACCKDFDHLLKTI